MFVRLNLTEGTLDSTLGVAGASLDSAGLAVLPEITTPEKVRVVLDPLRVHGEPEIVDIVVHDINDSEATVVRAVEEPGRFAAREHPVGTKWVLADTVDTLPFSADAGQVYIGARDLTNDGGQAVVSPNLYRMVRLTQAEYDLLETNGQLDGATVYFTVDAEGS